MHTQKSVAEVQWLDGDGQAVQFNDLVDSQNPPIHVVPLVADIQVEKCYAHATQAPAFKTYPCIQAVTVFLSGHAAVLAAQAVQVAVLVKQQLDLHEVATVDDPHSAALDPQATQDDVVTLFAVTECVKNPTDIHPNLQAFAESRHASQAPALT